MPPDRFRSAVGYKSHMRNWLVLLILRFGLLASFSPREAEQCAHSSQRRGQPPTVRRKQRITLADDVIPITQEAIARGSQIGMGPREGVALCRQIGVHADEGIALGDELAVRHSTSIAFCHQLAR